MFRIKMSDAKLWKNLISAISTLIDEATFNIEQNGITLRAMDPSHVAMVDFEWSKNIFDEYLCDEPTKLCININEMLKLLRRVGEDETLELKLENAHLLMILKSKYTRTFRMITLEGSSEEVPTPKISFDSVVKITSTCLKDTISDASTISDHIQFETTDKAFIMRASGHLGSVTIEMDKESEEVLGLEIMKASKAMFSLNYLSEMVKGASNLSDIVALEFSSDMPIRLNFALPQSGKLQYYLAPRIEST